jgi:hypothetical protein
MVISGIIYYAMIFKWTYLSVLKHPHEDIHQLVQVDHAGNRILAHELTPPNGIPLLQLTLTTFAYECVNGIKPLVTENVTISRK